MITDMLCIMILVLCLILILEIVLHHFERKELYAYITHWNIHKDAPKKDFRAPKSKSHEVLNKWGVCVRWEVVKIEPDPEFIKAV